MNWLKKRKKSLLRVKPQNNFGTRNSEIFSTILPLGMFKKFLSAKLNLHEVSKTSQMRDSTKFLPSNFYLLKLLALKLYYDNCWN